MAYQTIMKNITKPYKERAVLHIRKPTENLKKRLNDTGILINGYLLGVEYNQQHLRMFYEKKFKEKFDFGISVINKSNQEQSVSLEISKIDAQGYTIQNLLNIEQVRPNEKIRVFSGLRLDSFYSLRFYQLKQITIGGKKLNSKKSLYDILELKRYKRKKRLRKFRNLFLVFILIIMVILFFTFVLIFG